MVRNGTEIAIVGMACRMPGANHYEEFWRNLSGSVSSIAEITPDRWDKDRYFSSDVEAPGKTVSKWCGLVADVDAFDAGHFGISPREAKSIDPQQRLFLEETWRCMDDAGLALSVLQRRTTAVFAAVMATDYQQESSTREEEIDGYACQGGFGGIIANRVSYVLGLRGPSFAIDAGCAGSLVAIHQAVRALRAGECEFAFAGGVSLNLRPWKYISFSKARMLSPDGRCRTFDKDANGYVPGDGCGVVLLQRLADALREGSVIHGVIRGVAVNHGGAASSLTAPRVEAQREVILAAQRDAGVSPDTITYVEAHGTGTSLGDPIEVTALTQAFRTGTERTGYCDIGSVKTNVGHLEAAAGVAGLIKVLLMLRYKRIAPTLNVATVNPLIDFATSPFRLADSREWEPAIERERPVWRGCVSSFGFGGVNSHVVVEALERPVADTPRRGSYPFYLSARTERSLHRLLSHWRGFSSTRAFEETPLESVSGTLTTGRASFTYRAGAMVSSHEDVRAWLASDVRVTQAQTEAVLVTGRHGWRGYEDLVRAEGWARPLANELEELRARIAASHPRIADNIFADRWNDVDQRPLSLVGAFARARVLQRFGVTVASIACQGPGALLGLCVAGMVSLEDALLLLADPGAVIPAKRPVVSFWDPVAQRLLRPSHCTVADVAALFARQDLSSEDLARALHDGRLLFEHQQTFRRMLLGWNDALRSRGTSIEELLAHEGLDAPRGVLVFLAIRSALQAVRRKWALDAGPPAKVPYDNAIELISADALSRDTVVACVLGESGGDVAAARELNETKGRVPSLGQNVGDIAVSNEWLSRFPLSIDPAAIDGFLPIVLDGAVREGELGERAVSCAERPLLAILLDLQKRGQSIDWSLVYPEGSFSKAVLPVYEFDRKRYWLGAAPSPAERDSKVSQTGPSSWRRALSPTLDAVIRDTVVGDDCITPSPLRLEMALQVARCVGGPQVNTLRNLVFPSPGLIRTDCELTIVSRDGTQFELMKETELLCRGGWGTSEPPSGTFDAGNLPPRSPLEKAALYELFAKWGYRYGPKMSLIRRIWEGPEDLVAEIDDSGTEEGRHTGLDPFVLDCMFQAVFYAGHRLRDLFAGGFISVPLTIDRLVIGALVRGPCLVVLRKDDFKIIPNGDMLLSFQAYDQRGSAIFAVEGIYFKRVNRTFLVPTRKSAGEHGAPSLDGAPAPAVREREEDRMNLREKTSAYLKGLLAEVLHTSPQEIHENGKFKDDYGVDSLVNLSIVEKLEKVLGPLNKTLLYEYNTVATLSDHLVARHRALLPTMLGVAPAPATPPARAAVPARSAPIAAPPTTPDLPSALTSTRERAAKPQRERIAIIGISGRFPGASNVEQLWENLLAGTCSITEVPAERWRGRDYYEPKKKTPGKSYTRHGGFLADYDSFDSLFFNIPPRQAKQMDPQQRIFLETAYAAAEDAGYARRRLARNTGVFVGVTTNTYALFGAEESAKGNFQCPDTDNYDVANRVSYFFDLDGPSVSLDTACSSSLSAVHLAVRSLQLGECDMAIAGGVSLTLHPHRVVQFCQKGMLAEGGACHPFGVGAGGFVDSEGVGAIILKPLSQAVRDGDRVYATILGSSMNASGRTSGYTVPNPRAQASLVRRAIADAGIDARTISYVEAHGTGTIIGDPIELEGLTRAFREDTEDNQFCALGSLKSNLGHMIAAAGIGGLMKVILQMREKTLVPSLNCTPENPHVNFATSPFYMHKDRRPWERTRMSDGRESPRRAGVSSFGVGGANAHLVVEEHEAPPTIGETGNEDFAVILSAKNEAQLAEAAQRLVAFIVRRPEIAIADLAYTLQVGREPMEVRIACVVRSAGELRDALARFLTGDQRAVMTGNDRRARGLVELVEGDVQRVVIDSLIAAKAASKLAAFWVAGAEVPWERLYGSARPQIVSLPTYPFARQRHWLDTVGAAVPREALTFQTTFAARDPLVADHIVGGEPVVPGAGYLSALVDTLTSALETRSWLITELMFLRSSLRRRGTA